MHPGLCASDERYKEVCIVAKALERSMSKDSTGKYIMIYDSTDPAVVENPMLLFVADIRRRTQC
eukprot:12157626-Prorocentrum_lima.AAC.1